MRIGVTGHRSLPDPARWAEVRRDLAHLLSTRAAPGDEALSSLAIGADQLFAELALAAGLSLHAIVPCREYERCFAAGEEIDAYRALLSRASRVTMLDYQAPSEEAFEAAGHDLVRRCDWLITVWDGRPARGRGGTGDIVRYAASLGRPVVNVL